MPQAPLGLIHIYTGDGKGKTTAALGLASRAVGRGLKVKIIQFFKRDTGELAPLRSLGVSYEQFKPLHPFFLEYTQEALQDLKEHFQAFWDEQMRDVAQSAYNLLVIDEMGPALSHKIVPEDLLLRFLDEKPAHLEVIMTGRGFPESVLAQGDYVTEMKQIHHPYGERGIMARRGIEF